jgi:hypothetical protein
MEREGKKETGNEEEHKKRKEISTRERKTALREQATLHLY